MLTTGTKRMEDPRRRDGKKWNRKQFRVIARCRWGKARRAARNPNVLINGFARLDFRRVRVGSLATHSPPADPSSHSAAGVIIQRLAGSRSSSSGVQSLECHSERRLASICSLSSGGFGCRAKFSDNNETSARVCVKCAAFGAATATVAPRTAQTLARNNNNKLNRNRD